MQMAVCPLCRFEGGREAFAERGYAVLRCPMCDLFFIHPYPATGDVVHRRAETYEYQDLEIVGAERHYRGQIAFYDRHWPFIEEECRDARSVLDVGCGCGRLLQLLGGRADLFRMGIELNAERAAKARQVAGCEVHQLPVEEFTSDRRFDVITLINVLSHIPSFDDLFAALRSLLANGGRVILKVGELRSDVRKGDVFDWGIPDHLHFLGLATIGHICRAYGFSVKRHDRVPYYRELFTRSRWKEPGRSTARNLVKWLVAHTPLALPVLAQVYRMRHDERVWSSFIVLTKQERKDGV